MRLPRFRLRALMIAVGVVGIALALGIRSRLSILAARYRVQAVVHVAREANYQALLKQLTNPPNGPAQPDRRLEMGRVYRQVVQKPGSKDLLVEWVPPPELDRLAKPSSVTVISPALAKALAVYSRRVSYESSMRRKYEWLAEHPWESATPDPPSP